MELLTNPWVIIIGAYLFLCLVFYMIHEFFLFHPEVLHLGFKYKFPFPFDEVNLSVEDGGKINGIHFKVPNSKGVVFYFKGNTRSVKGWGKFARDFVGKGYDFFMVDYRGFGKSRGKRTEQIIYNDLQQVYRWLKSHYEEELIVIYGRSMGSGFATRIASWNNPKMLILDSPYYSFVHQINRYAFFLPVRWLLKYQIRTDIFIKFVKCPIFILHGMKDRLIPYNSSEKLTSLVPKKSTLFSIEDGRHNNLPSLPQYHDVLYNILHDNTLYARLKNKIVPSSVQQL